ncbi:uncharacterized protein LOC134665430 [Cydia fagiglandana]|uniref:uncharacterized protein LOC134665430 n=1 Tax=Cydia fagiglandana TaxID=1458189 RepID=UPI002FEDEEC8
MDASGHIPKKYAIIRFLKSLPIEGILHHQCVPTSWIHNCDDRVVVSCPRELTVAKFESLLQAGKKNQPAWGSLSAEIVWYSDTYLPIGKGVKMPPGFNTRNNLEENELEASLNETESNLAAGPSQEQNCQRIKSELSSNVQLKLRNEPETVENPGHSHQPPNISQPGDFSPVESNTAIKYKTPESSRNSSEYSFRYQRNEATNSKSTEYRDHFFVYKYDARATEDDVFNRLEKICRGGIQRDQCNIRQKLNSVAKYGHTAFNVEAPRKYRDDILDQRNWPDRVIVKLEQPKNSFRRRHNIPYKLSSGRDESPRKTKTEWERQDNSAKRARREREPFRAERRSQS